MTSTTLTIERELGEQARSDAQESRRRHAQRGTLVVHLLSSPGAGKTSLLARTLEQAPWRDRAAVLVGDLATDRDARRLEHLVDVVQLTTRGACHLELPLVERGFQALGRDDLEYLFIENVGNLVCPASFDLAEHLRVVLLSTTEGDDKPAKYAKAFRTSQALVIHKRDLLPYVPFSVRDAIEDARKIQSSLKIFVTSAHDPAHVADWTAYLQRERIKMLANADDFPHER